MRSLIMALAMAGALAASPATAQSRGDGDMARRLELSERYLELSQGSGLTKAMRRLYEDAFVKAEMPQAERTWLTENMIATMDQIMQATFRELRDDVAELFTVAELEASIAFMDSPAGRSITDKSLELSITTQQVMAPHLIAGFERLGEKYCAQFECEDEGGDLAKR